MPVMPLIQLGTSHRNHCRVCGFSEVRTDEAVDHGVVFLAECPRCEHRWTSTRPLGVASVAASSVAVSRGVRVAREVAPAA